MFSEGGKERNGGGVRTSHMQLTFISMCLIFFLSLLAAPFQSYATANSSAPQPPNTKCPQP